MRQHSERRRVGAVVERWGRVGRDGEALVEGSMASVRRSRG